jgi:hypothetical protein
METEEYTPVIPTWLRTAVFFAGVIVTAAAFIFPDADVLVRVGLAIGFLASTFGVAYNPLRSRFATHVAKQEGAAAVAHVAVAALQQVAPAAAQAIVEPPLEEEDLEGQDEPDDPETTP